MQRMRPSVLQRLELETVVIAAVTYKTFNTVVTKKFCIFKVHCARVFVSFLPSIGVDVPYTQELAEPYNMLETTNNYGTDMELTASYVDKESIQR
jgi:hypothetical protein